MNYGLICLSSKNVCAGNGEAARLGGGLFKGGVDGVGWVKSVRVDPYIFCDCGVGGFGFGQYRGDEVLRKRHCEGSGRSERGERWYLDRARGEDLDSKAAQ